MTNKEIEQLNIKIAKKLGWKRFRKENTPEPLNTRKMTGLAPGNIRNQFVPNYMFNLSYALKCVDWAVEHGYKFELTKKPNDKIYYARFLRTSCREDFPIYHEVMEKGDISSIAICNAFLKLK
jgi:hypothetical protein